MNEDFVNTTSFIINPVAGGKRKDFLVKLLHDEIGPARSKLNVFFTSHKGHASEITRNEIARGSRIVVAVGGDGTINEIARELMNTPVKLGVIPYGSGNGFARHFGFPLNLKEALHVLKDGRSKRIDVGIVNAKPFFCTSGMGFDAETGYQFSHFGERGFISYAFSFLRVFKSYKALEYRIHINGKSLEREAFFINVANISQFGYNFKIAPGASADDGFLDLVIVNKFPKWKGPWLAMQSFTGNIHKNPVVEYHTSRNLSIELLSRKKHIHIDGEPERGEEIMTYSINPKALDVILPFGLKGLS